MQNNNFKPKGICLTRNHEIYGSIFINKNKYNKPYIRQIKDDVTNNYSIDDNYINNDITLEDVVKIISTIDVKQQVKTIEEEVKVKKGKLLGKYNSMSVFLNNGKFSPYLKVNGDDKLYNIKHYVDIDKIDLEAAISIINDYKNKQFRYNNSSVVLHDEGKYGPYIKYDNTNIKLPKNKSNLTQDDVNSIIDTYLKNKDKLFDANELYKTVSVPTNDINNESVHTPVYVTLPSIPPKPISYVDIIKNKNKT